MLKKSEYRDGFKNLDGLLRCDDGGSQKLFLDDRGVTAYRFLSGNDKDLESSRL